MAHINKRSHSSSSNDSLILETSQMVKIVASDMTNNSKTDGGGGNCDQHSLQSSKSILNSNARSCAPAQAANSSGNSGSLGGILKTYTDEHGAGRPVSDVGGAGCSTGKDFSSCSGHCNVGIPAVHCAGYKIGYSQGLQSGFQAGYEEARKELRKAAGVNNSSKNLSILALENKTEDAGAAQGLLLAREDKAATSMQQNVQCLTNGDEFSSSDSKNSSMSFLSWSSASTGVHSEPQLSVVLHNQPKQVKFRKQQSSLQEQLLAEHTTEVFHQPLSSGALGAPGDKPTSAPADCSICMTDAAEISPYQTDQDVSRDLVGCVAMKLCGHHFHTSCLIQMASHNTSCLTCPNCQTIHGVRMGIQPKGGKMDVQKSNNALPGFPNSATYQIVYSFPPGIQGAEHPRPGSPYHLVGFPRVAYIPATDEGERVLKLLRVAFDRRLIFTVGTSATSGMPDCVVWNGIHHKTEAQNYSGHGYPDPKYLGNVLMELASFGVTD